MVTATKQALVPTPRTRILRPDRVSYLFAICFGSLLMTLTTLFVLLAAHHGLRTTIFPVATIPRFNLGRWYEESMEPRARISLRAVPKIDHTGLRSTLFRDVTEALRETGPRTPWNRTYLEDLATLIVEESVKGRYDPLFITALIKHESRYDRKATSPKGAKGLMQILPSTGEYVARTQNLPWRGAESLKEVRYNLTLGISYLRYLERRFGARTEHILIAYNWGPANLTDALTNGTRIPREPITYARRVLATHARWRNRYPLRQG
jgi:soluble lytic murein transglycosylase-like protein